MGIETLRLLNHPNCFLRLPREIQNRPQHRIALREVGSEGDSLLSLGKGLLILLFVSIDCSQYHMSCGQGFCQEPAQLVPESSSV